ncbi:MAG: hypothetical protein CW691_03270 [Candidatus Bathyarchaeum sp.]|nr:MAG: hypothetical protein CW691_03270 [Candidatus Bathyarchaeum sp.]
MSNHGYNEVMLEVIERGLDSLGESPKKAVWIVLEEQFNVDRNKIPIDVKEITDALQKLFGLGYSFLDALFKQYLEDATGRIFEDKNFLECVASLQGESDSIQNHKR